MDQPGQNAISRGTSCVDTVLWGSGFQRWHTKPKMSFKRLPVTSNMDPETPDVFLGRCTVRGFFRGPCEPSLSGVDGLCYPRFEDSATFDPPGDFYLNCLKDGARWRKRAPSMAKTSCTSSTVKLSKASIGSNSHSANKNTSKHHDVHAVFSNVIRSELGRSLVSPLKGSNPGPFCSSEEVIASISTG